MALYALLSAGGSPGVTTTAVALTLSWPSQVIMAEFDPSGGDALAGLLRGHLPASTGLLPLALETGAGAEIPADALWRQLVELDEERSRLLLAGIGDPRQSAALQSSLPWIADALKTMPGDVIADCGRLDAVAAVRPVLSAASLAVLVLRPTLRQVSRAVSRIEMLTGLVGPDRLLLLVVGDGPASAREVARTLGVRVAAQLPDDAKTALVLSDGQGGRHRLESRPLIRAATTVGRALREAVATVGPLLGDPEQAIYAPADPDPYDLDQFTAAGPPALGQPAMGQPVMGQSAMGQPASRQHTAQPGLLPPAPSPSTLPPPASPLPPSSALPSASSTPPSATLPPSPPLPPSATPPGLPVRPRRGQHAMRPPEPEPSPDWSAADRPSADWPSADPLSADWPAADPPSADWPGADWAGTDWPGPGDPDGEPPASGPLPPEPDISRGFNPFRSGEPEIRRRGVGRRGVGRHGAGPAGTGQPGGDQLGGDQPGGGPDGSGSGRLNGHSFNGHSFHGDEPDGGQP
jgi:hypothetical protein